MSSNVVDISDIYQSMTDCMQTCQNFQNSRVPEIQNKLDMLLLAKKLEEAVYIPGSAKFLPKECIIRI